MLEQADPNKQLSQLPPGSIVVVEVSTPAGQRTKFKSHFIGFYPKKFVLIQMPDLSKNRKLASFLHDKTKCTVRGLSEGQAGLVIAFNSVIKHTIKMPAPMLVMQLPAKVALQSLRKVSRIDTEISINIQIDKYYWQGQLLNLSALGCLISFTKTQEIDISDSKSVKITIADSNYHCEGEFIADICNVKTSQQTVELGVAFVEQSKKAATRLLNQVLFD